MTDFVRRRPMLSAVLGLSPAVRFLIGSFPIVPETKQAVVVRFGKPVADPQPVQGRAADRRRGRRHFLANPVRRAARVDRQARPGRRHGQRQQVLSTDQRRLEVDAFARYRIVDPLLMYIRAGTEEQLTEQLRPILGSEVRNELGKRRSPRC